MTLLGHVLGALALTSGAVAAQTPRLADFLGSTWGYYSYETGSAMETVLSGMPSLGEGHPDVVITLVSRDGHPLQEADRAEGARLARALCIRQGRVFNSASQGNWLPAGGLSFDGACTQ